MAKPEWGAKHTCQHCGVKYYDLLRSPAICPQCKTAFNPDALLRSRRGKPAPHEKAPAAVAAVAPAAEAEESVAEGPEDETLVAPKPDDEDVDDLAEAEAEAEDDKLIEDTSELGEDDEDVAEVMVGDGEREDT